MSYINLSGTFSHSLEPKQIFFQRDLVTTLCQLLPRNNVRAPSANVHFWGLGRGLPLPVSSVAFAALHDAFGVLTPICSERTAHVVL
jgi:hypothetical protein